MEKFCWMKQLGKDIATDIQEKRNKIMYVQIETCRGGFLMEVRMEHGDPTYCLLPGQMDFKEVFPSFVAVEERLRELFMGKNYEATIEGHGVKSG